MGKLLRKIQKYPSLHHILRGVYGKTIGIWWLKDLYAKNIGFYNGEERLKLLGKTDSEKMIAKKIGTGKDTVHRSIQIYRRGTEDQKQRVRTGESSINKVYKELEPIRYSR